MKSYYNLSAALDFLQELYYDDEHTSKVERIIFVASASSIAGEFPSELIRAVISQAMEGRRGIYFGYENWYVST